MSSRVWTEVATGAEARSLRRWARRAVVPAVARCALVFALLLVGLVAYSELIWVVARDPLEPGIRPSRLIRDAIDNFFGEGEAPRIGPRFIDY